MSAKCPLGTFHPLPCKVFVCSCLLGLAVGTAEKTQMTESDCSPKGPSLYTHEPPVSRNNPPAASLSLLTARRGRALLTKPYGKRRRWAQHGISPLSDRTWVPYQIALIAFLPLSLPWTGNAARASARQEDGTAALFLFSPFSRPEGAEQQFYQKLRY